MKTAVIYCSKYGTTQKVAGMIAVKLSQNNPVTLISLNETPEPDLSGYSKVILGTSVYAGRPMGTMNKFCGKYREVLKDKGIGLFVCGIDPSKKESELGAAYPEYLHRIAKAEAFMGGELLFDDMNFFVRGMMKKIAKTDQPVYKIDVAAIDDFSSKMN